MQIQRAIEESMGACQRDMSGGAKVELTMRHEKSTSDSAAAPTSPASVSEANSSFLHGSEWTKNSANNEASANDKIVYATIDRLALKRARLPLQLVPIDDDTCALEKREKNNGEKRSNAGRKNCPRRPSFKVRPGVPVSSVQWRSRGARPSNRAANQPVGKFENVSKELVSRLIIFENIIRNSGDRNCGTFKERDGTEPATDQEVPQLLTEVNGGENSPVIHAESPREPRRDQDIGEAANSPQEASLLVPESSASDSSANTTRGSSIEVNGTRGESTPQISSISVLEDSERLLESTSPQISSSQRDLSELSSTPDNNNRSLSTRTKRYRHEFTFAKSVLHRAPSQSDTDRAKKSNCASKNRKNVDRSIGNDQSNLKSHRSLSREELRHSISLPTNFVHLASATNSKLLSNGQDGGNSKLPVINHEEKRAELRYLGQTDSREIQIAKVVGKIVRNSGDDGASTRSSSLSLDNARHDDEARAKVSALENSQGAPEVVKRSENEGNDAREELSRDEEEPDAPVYEAMSEFLAEGFASRANASFLWGGQKTSLEREIAPSGHEIIPKIDLAIGGNDLDAYDDVGLSRDEPEEDHYDDVGLPSTNTRSSSTATLFEEIGVDGELYDDVLPGPIGESSASGATAASGSDGDAIGCSNSCTEETAESRSPLPKRRAPSLRSENAESQYLSISNDYSSVEEDPDDFEDEPDDGLYDDVELPSQERVNSLYAGSSSGSQLGSLCNGKESEWEDLEDTGPVLPLPKKATVASRHADSQTIPGKKKTLQRWSKKVRRQKSKASRKSAASRAASTKGTTSTFSVAVSLGTGSVLLVGSGATANHSESLASPDRLPPGSLNGDEALTASRTGDDLAVSSLRNAQLQTRGLVQLRVLGSPEDSVDTQETSCYVLEDTASDDSNYETLFSFPSDEFSSGSDGEESVARPSSSNGDVAVLQGRFNGIFPEAPSRPVPPPPRESSLTETFGKRMKMLRRTWSITKGSLGRMRRRTSASAETETNVDDPGKYSNSEQQHSPNNDGRRYFGFKKHFKKSSGGLSTFYLDNERSEGRLSRNNNCSKEEIYGDCGNSNWYTNTDYWRSNVSQQTQRNDVDHYSLLDEEPLYQFYAAAAARVAFESDSEGYEEVEDPTPSASTVDLAKPGHRTLWCQTPQVANSALLQRLTADEKKMQEAKFEIFTSEASYLNSLRVLVDEFFSDHELVHEILTPSEREKLFGGVPSVLLASERLLAELEAAWREDVMLRGLPGVLLNYAQRSSSVYVAYCSNQVSIDTTLKELRSKKGSKFADAVKRIESHPACQNLSLHSFLMLPMQRVTRLPLLADAVLSRVPADSKDERACWECVLSQLSQVVMECNEGARAAGRFAEMEALERKLEYSSKVPPIVLRDRYLVRRGPVVQMLSKPDAEYKLTFGKRHHKAPLYLLLLTDYLLIAKPKSNANEETYTVIDTCKRSLVALEKVTEDSPFAGRHAMVLSLLENYSGRHVEYILTCVNATERERWLDAVSPPKPSLVGETLYETWDCPQVMALYPYAAAQPDELTLQPGDVINVLRKMTDGWHLGEKLLGGEQGWFPGNYAKEVASEHVRARNLRQRHRLLALSASVLQQRAKQTSRLH